MANDFENADDLAREFLTREPVPEQEYGSHRQRIAQAIREERHRCLAFFESKETCEKIIAYVRDRREAAAKAQSDLLRN